MQANVELMHIGLGQCSKGGEIRGGNTLDRCCGSHGRMSSPPSMCTSTHQWRLGHAREPLVEDKGFETGRSRSVCGVVKGMCEAPGTKGIAKDMGLDFSIILSTCFSVAKGIAIRKGLVKVKHLETRTLRAQDKIDEGKVVVKKIGGDRNVADILTKYFSSPRLRSILGEVPVAEVEGRHSLVPQLQGKS